MEVTIPAMRLVLEIDRLVHRLFVEDDAPCAGYSGRAVTASGWSSRGLSIRGVGPAFQVWSSWPLKVNRSVVAPAVTSA